MRTKCCHRYLALKLAFLIAGVFLIQFGVTNAEAQVNTSRVLREATGKYKLVRQGGSATFDDGMNAPTIVTPPTVRGTTKIPVKSNRPVMRMKETEFPGSGVAVYRGTRKRAKVNGAGNRINYLASGTGDEDDGFGLYRGSTKGTFRKRGSGWAAALVMSSVQTQGGTTKTVTGMKIGGRK